MTVLSILLVGFLLGLKHATETDHLAAVATLVTRQTNYAQTLMQGAAWGLGHTLTLMLVGGTVLLLGKQVPPNLEHALEFGVGLMLIALGADVLRRLVRNRVHFHVHSHASGVRHVHAHAHAEADAQAAHAAARAHVETHHDHSHRLPLRALAVGTMHGLAGSAALVLLSLEAVQSWQMGLVYIAVFGLGSIAGMALLSVAIAVPLRLSARRLGRLHTATSALFGAFSCVLGGYLVVEIGFVRGLLAAAA
jgi:high-affinity nickel permease